MNQTAPPTSTTATTGTARRVPMQRSLDPIAAIAVVAERLPSTLRPVGVGGVETDNTVTMRFRTAGEARTAAVALGFSASSHTVADTHYGVAHTWSGVVDGAVHLSVCGVGDLAATPAAVLAGPDWSQRPDLGPCPDDVHAALVGDDTTPAVTA